MVGDAGFEPGRPTVVKRALTVQCGRKDDVQTKDAADKAGPLPCESEYILVLFQ